MKNGYLLELFPPDTVSVFWDSWFVMFCCQSLLQFISSASYLAQLVSTSVFQLQFFCDVHVFPHFSFVSFILFWSGLLIKPITVFECASSSHCSTKCTLYLIHLMQSMSHRIQLGITCILLFSIIFDYFYINLNPENANLATYFSHYYFCI